MGELPTVPVTLSTTSSENQIGVLDQGFVCLGEVSRQNLILTHHTHCCVRVLKYTISNRAENSRAVSPLKSDDWDTALHCVPPGIPNEVVGLKGRNQYTSHVIFVAPRVIPHLIHVILVTTTLPTTPIMKDVVITSGGVTFRYPVPK